MNTSRSRLPFLGRLFVLCCLLAGGAALAHSPHDDVFDLAVLSREDGSSRMFVTVRGNLLYSDDDGTSWRRALNGLRHKHQLFSIATAPTDPDLVFVGSLGEGAFRSTDGGNSWTHLGDALPGHYIQRLVVSPAQADVVAALASDGRLFLSQDGGDSWTTVAVGNGEIVDQVAISSDGSRLVIALASRSLVAHNLTDLDARPQSLAADLGSRVMSLVPSQDDPSRWLAGLQDGQLLEISSAHGEPKLLWRAPNGEPVRSAAFGTTDEPWDILAVAEMEGPWCRAVASGDWSPCNSGLTIHRQAMDLGRPYFSILQSFAAPGRGTQFLLAGYDGLFRSADPSSSWSHVNTLGLNLITGLAVSRQPSGEDAIYLTTYLWGAYESTDGGDAWRGINAGANDYRRPAGYTRLFNIYPVIASGETPTLFTSTWYRWLRMEPGAGRWTQVKFVDDEAWLATHHGITAAFSPGFADDGVVLLASDRGPILRSTDHGRTFQVVSSLPEPTNQMVIAEQADGSREVFAAGVGTLFKSTDDGSTWEPVLDVGTLRHPDAALTGRGSILHEIGGPAWLEQITSNDFRTSAGWVEVSPDFARDRIVIAGGIDGIFRSTDGGASFVPLHIGEAVGPVDGFAISPGFAHDRTLLISIRGQGLLISRDAGETFAPIGTTPGGGKVQLANYHSYPVPISPPLHFSPDFARNNTIYGFEGADLWRSTDGGQTWGVAWSPAPDAETLKQLRMVHFRGDIDRQWNSLKTSRKRQAAAGAVVMLLLGAGVLLLRRRRAQRPSETPPGRRTGASV